MQATKKKIFKSPAFTAPLKSESHSYVVEENEKEHVKNEAADEKKNVPEKTELYLNVPEATPKDFTHDLQKETNKEKSEKAKAKKRKHVDNNDNKTEQKKKKKLKEKPFESMTTEDLCEVPAGASKKQDDALKKPKKEKLKKTDPKTDDTSRKTDDASKVAGVASKKRYDPSLKSDEASDKPDTSSKVLDNVSKKPKKEKKPKLFVRSLSDEEYKELFAAVIQGVISKNSVGDENEPGEPGTLIDSEETLQGHDNNGGCKEQPRKNIDKEHTTNDLEKVIDDDVENRMNGIKEEKELEEEEEEEESDKDNNHVVNEAIEADEAQDHQVPESTEDMQLKNEITPAGSEFEFDQSIPVPSSQQVRPAHKNKKKRTNVKKSELHPHHLPFSDAKQKGEHKEKISLEEEKREKKPLKEKMQNGEAKKVKCRTEAVHKSSIMKKKTAKQKLSDLVHLHKQSKKRETERDEEIKIKKKGHSRKKIMLERNLEGSGTWVQCCNPSCQKWRYLSDIQDPIKVPEKWFCSMNTNENFSSCDKKEEEYNETDHIFTKFTEGSIVWVKMSGYPWWPAMVEIDPDAECFFDVESFDSMIPSHYHVVFLDNRVSRAWVKARYIKLFMGKDDVEVAQKTMYKKDIAAAKENAIKASELDLKDRIRQFGFAGRFRGKWGYYSSGKNSQESMGSQKKVRKQVKPKVRIIHEDSSVESDSGGEMSLEMIDEPIMSDLLNNTDSILEDMEMVLESLEGEPLEEDSEYIPFKGKQKKGKDSYRLQQNKAMEKKKKDKEERRDENTISKKKLATLKRKTDEHSSAKRKLTKAGEIVQSKDAAHQRKESQTLENENTVELLTDTAEVIIKKEKHESVVADVEMVKIKINKLTRSKEEAIETDHIVTKALKFDSEIFTMELGDEYNDIEDPDSKSNDKKNPTLKAPKRIKNDPRVDQSASKAFKLCNDVVTMEPESENQDAEVPKSSVSELKMEQKTVCFDNAVLDTPEPKSHPEIETNTNGPEEENKTGALKKDSGGNKKEDEMVADNPNNCDKGKEGKNKTRQGDDSTQKKSYKKTIRVNNEPAKEGQTSDKEKIKVSNEKPSENSEPKSNEKKQFKEPSAITNGGNVACLEPKKCVTTSKKESKEEGTKKSFIAPSSVHKFTENSSVETKKCDLAKKQESKEEDDRERDYQEDKFKEQAEEDIGEEITFDLSSKINVERQIKVPYENNDESDGDFDIDTSLYDSVPGSIKQNIVVQMDNHINVERQIKVPYENNDESDGDFDIDTSLYDSVPGSIKQNIVVQTDNHINVFDHDDSDPFEMIEE